MIDDDIHVRSAPGPDAPAQQHGFTLRAREVTRKLRSELRKVRAPDTDDGRKAAALFDEFARIASQRTAAEELRVRGLPENITRVQSVRSLQHLEVVLRHAFLQMSSAHRTIMTQLPELKEPFENADSCKELDALGTD